MLPRICASDSYSCSSIQRTIASRTAVRHSGPCWRTAETICTVDHVRAFERRKPRDYPAPPDRLVNLLRLVARVARQSYEASWGKVKRRPMASKVPRYDSFHPKSPRASAAARGSSRKAGTQPELLLRRALWKRGLRYRKNRVHLTGVPDLVFPGARIAVFVDGDFWHGKDWARRKAKLQRGHNAAYWVAKIERNIQRDQERQRELHAAGWKVLRFWESEIRRDPEKTAARLEAVLRK